MVARRERSLIGGALVCALIAAVVAAGCLGPGPTPSPPEPIALPSSTPEATTAALPAASATAAPAETPAAAPPAPPGAPVASLGAFTLSPDGMRLAFAASLGSRSGVHVLDRRTGSIARLAAPDGGYVVQLAWSPRGERLLVARRGPDGITGCWLVDLASGTLSPLGSEGDDVLAAAWLGDGRHALLATAAAYGARARVLDVESNGPVADAVLPGTVVVGSLDRSGRHLSYRCNGTLRVAELGESHRDALVSQSPSEGEAGSFSPADDVLAFAGSLLGRDGLLLAHRPGDVTAAAIGPEGARSPAWSPDGTAIAFVRTGGGLAAVNLTTGAEREVDPAIPRGPVLWTQAGELVYLAADGRYVAAGPDGSRATLVEPGSVAWDIGSG